MCKLGQNRRNKHGHKPEENGGFGRAYFLEKQMAWVQKFCFTIIECDLKGMIFSSSTLAIQVRVCLSVAPPGNVLWGDQMGTIIKNHRVAHQKDYSVAES